MPSFKDIFRRNKRPRKRPDRPEYRKYNVQPLFSNSRPRALTLPLPSTAPDLSTTVKQRTSPQTSSLLMRLPLELRMQIYEAVLGHHKVHVAFDFGSRWYRTCKRNEVLEWRWWHTICTWDHVEDDDKKNIWHDRCVTGRVKGNPGPPNGMMGNLKLDFALLLSCRQVYSEAIDILYSTTTFTFSTHQLLRSFPSLVQPHRFANITSIEQIWDFVNFCLPDIPAEDKKLYNEMWSMLANMPNLRHIKIGIATYRCPNPVPVDVQEQWLGPLKQLKDKDLETFEVLVPESYGINFDVDETSQFKLITFPDVNDIHFCTLGTGF